MSFTSVTERQPSLAWDFNGTTTDYVSGVVPTTTTGTITYASGKYLQSAVFTNTAGSTASNALTYTLSSITSLTNGFTVACWFKINSVPPSGQRSGIWRVPASGAGNGGAYMLYYASGQTNFGYTQIDQVIPYVEFSANFGALAVGTWYHAVYTISGTTQTAYLNGVLKATDSRLTGTYTLTNPTMSLGFHAAFGDAFNGEVDDLRIYNTALTSIQVNDIYNQQGVPGRGVVSIPTPQGISFTGTPLFTQLSPAATSSAVGAFSLRAVNGITARAVNVAPGGAFPILGFSTAATQSTNQFTQTLTGYPFTGSYVANCSSFYSASGTEQPWRCFDKNNNGTWWTTSIGSYSSSTGLYAAGVYSTTISGSAYAGEWIQIRLPVSITLLSYTIYNASSFNNRAPVDFKIAGSNDGITWTLVDTQTAITSWLSSTTSLTFTPSIQTTAYSYYRLCVNKYGGASGGYLTIGEMVLNGTVPSLAQDFYADERGNLLTAPVTGTTLQNWLGSATGYVTTWYDQSGRGNHMSCSSVANQPKIDLVNNFIDLKPSAYFDVSAGTTGPVPFQSSKNYTVVFRHGQFIGSGLFSAVQNAGGPYGNLVNNFKKGTGSAYTQYWYGNDVNNKGVLATGNRVSYKWDGTNRSLYVNGTLADATPSSGWAQTSGANQMIGKTTFDAAMNGELYGAFMFTTALSDMDRTLLENFL